MDRLTARESEREKIKKTHNNDVNLYVIAPANENRAIEQ